MSDEAGIKKRRWFAALIEEMQGDRTQKEFGKLLNVTATTVQDWLGRDNGGISRTDPDNIRMPIWRAIAELRGVSSDELTEEMRQAVEQEGSGVLPTPKPEDSVYVWYANVSRLVATLQTELRQFEKHFLENAMCQNAINRLIQSAFEARGFSTQNPLHVREFVDLAGLEGIRAEQIRLTVIGRLQPLRNNLPALAKALTRFTGTEYSYDELERLAALPAETFQGQDCPDLDQINRLP